MLLYDFFNIIFLTCGFDFFGPKNTNIPFFMISGNIKREKKIFVEFNGFL